MPSDRVRARPRSTSSASRRIAGIVLAASLMALGACGEPEVPPPVSLDGPGQFTASSVCLVGSERPRLRVAPERCESDEFGDETTRVLSYLYISNRDGDSVAVADFNRREPQLIDVKRNVPGVTHIPVGETPTHIAASRDGNFIFAFNEAEQEISVVADALREEVARIPIGEAVAAMKTAPADDALWLLLPDSGRILEIGWSFSCDGEAEYREDCEPEIEHDASALFAFEQGVKPRHMTISPASSHAFVTFADRAWMAEIALTEPGDGDDAVSCEGGGEVPCMVRRIGLTAGCSDGLDNDDDGQIDAADPQCLTPDAGESAEGIGRGRPTACNDGVDNDGDGLVDAADGGCRDDDDDSETESVAPVACSDGVDSDGDGLVDIADPGCCSTWESAELPGGVPAIPCDTGEEAIDQDGDGQTDIWIPWGADEETRPACSDGLDNDGDGEVDEEDNDCVSPEQDDEGRKPECSDLIDNDGDDLIDGDDPDCHSPLLDDESGALTACNDGLDNDHDGVVDLRDPGCTTPQSTSEVLYTTACDDGVDNDGDGDTDYPEDSECYGRSGLSEDTGRELEFGPLAVDPEGRFAYVVDRSLSQLLIIDLEEGRLLDPNVDRPFDSRLGVPVGRLPLSVAARRTEQTTMESPDGSRRVTRTTVFANVATSRGFVYYVVAAEIFRAWEGEEMVDERFNTVLRLSDRDSGAAFSSALTCTLTQDVIDRVLEISGDEPRREVTCTDPELPQLAPITENGDGDGDSEEPPPTIRFDTREQTALQINDEGEFEEEVLEITEDFFIPDDNWEIIYEGVITTRSDLIVDEEVSGLIRSQGLGFCNAGVREGDLLTITSSPTPAPGEDVDCSAFQNATRMYRVERVRSNLVQVRLLTEEELDAIELPEDAPPVVSELPRRECFMAGMAADVRAAGEWVIVGERTGFLTNQTNEAGVCVKDYQSDVIDGRIRSGEVYANPYFSFRLTEGEITPPRGFTISFSTTDQFRSFGLSVGPTPTDIQEVETPVGVFLPVVDAGSDVVRIFSARTNELITVLF